MTVVFMVLLFLGWHSISCAWNHIHLDLHHRPSPEETED